MDDIDIHVMFTVTLNDEQEKKSFISFVKSVKFLRYMLLSDFKIALTPNTHAVVGLFWNDNVVTIDRVRKTSDTMRRHNVRFLKQELIANLTRHRPKTFELK